MSRKTRAGDAGDNPEYRSLSLAIATVVAGPATVATSYYLNQVRKPKDPAPKQEPKK